MTIEAVGANGPGPHVISEAPTPCQEDGAGSFKVEAGRAQKSALELYWSAKSPAEERAALKALKIVHQLIDRSGAEPPVRPVGPSRAAWEEGKKLWDAADAAYKRYAARKMPPRVDHLAKPRDEEWAVR